jgi:acyl carrier protein
VSVRPRLVQELATLLYGCVRLSPPTPALTADEPLFGGRLPLDSVDSLQWATAIEQRYQCELTDRDIAGGALESLGRMADALLARGVLPLAAPAESGQDARSH